MNIEELLTLANRASVALYVDGETVRFHPASSITPEMRAGLQIHKQALLKILPPVKCLKCGAKIDIKFTSSFTINKCSSDFFHYLTSREHRRTVIEKSRAA